MSYSMVQFGKLIKSDNAGEVIPKEYWNEGSELLYTCQKTPMFSTYSIFQDRRRTNDGDLLLTRNGTPYIFIPELNSIYSNVVQRVVLDVEKLNPYFAKYALEDSALNMQGNGDIIASFNMGIWKRLQIPLPDLATQQRIAAFLDSETGKIDNLVDELTKFKGKLQTQRKSLISECVTKGIPSERDRAYNDSRVEWLGDIPASWELTKLKYNYFFGMGETILREEVSDNPQDGYPIYSATESDTVFGYKKDIRTILSQGDFVLPARGNSIGSITIVPEPAGCTQTTMWLKSKLHMNSEFVYWFMCGWRDIIFAYDRNAIPQLTIQQASNATLTLPPLYEQQRIADYLNIECSRIDALIGEIDNQVNLLKTYRKSLINEVVTGKVEV